MFCIKKYDKIIKKFKTKEEAIDFGIDLFFETKNDKWAITIEEITEEERG